MVPIFHFLTVLSVAALGLALSVESTADDVFFALGKVSRGMNTLNNAAAACSTNTTLATVSALHVNAIALSATVTAATTVVINTSTFDKTASRTILSYVQLIEPNILNVLAIIVGIKASLAALAVRLVAQTLQDLIALRTATLTLFIALASILSADLQSQLFKIKILIARSFTTAIDAYSPQP
ncbi:hypothetical protein B0H11DRAFT_2052620 [Mycena galericulata]|nr:hypothetical protein B0H11DRAFT_2052620 [Mycena galericulata]